MAKDSVVTGGSPVSGSSNSATGGNAKVARKRREYDHEMTEAEKYALQTVLKTKNALSACAVKIQEGKSIPPGVVKACLALQVEAAEVLFS